jgi:hypothetical protein
MDPVQRLEYLLSTGTLAITPIHNNRGVGKHSDGYEGIERLVAGQVRELRVDWSVSILGMLHVVLTQYCDKVWISGWVG